MKHRFTTAIQIIALMVVGVLAGFAAGPQQAAPPSIKEQLAAQYKLTKTSFRSGALQIVEPGTVVVLQTDGVPGLPPTNFNPALVEYKNGELHPPGSFSQRLMGPDMRFLQKGEKVYITRIGVNLKADKIYLNIVECDSCNGVEQPSSYHSMVGFPFAKGSLQTTSVPDIEDTIAKVFALDTTTAEAPPAPQPEPPAPAPAPAAPASIQLGQTIDQVVAILGQPDKMVNLGAKQIYVYKDLKVTFVNGKVSDVK